MDFEIDAFELAKNWIPSLLDGLIKIRTERAIEINAIANTFGDPLILAKYYIEPDCQQVNPADYPEDAHIVREPIFRRIETFLSGDPMRANSQLFILSDAGMGKTSVLMILKLSHITSFWPKGYDCSLLKLGANSIELIGAIQNKRKTVLLLDALDEDPSAWGRTSPRMNEILKATQNFFRVIITCRTQFFNANVDPFNRRGQVEIFGHLCPVVYASLFTDGQVASYVKKRFPIKFVDSEWRATALNIINKMGFLRMRPMILAHLEDLVESTETVWTEYTLYRALISAWLLREQRKDAGAAGDYSNRILSACEYMAFMMMESERFAFSDGETALISRVANESLSGSEIDLRGRSLLNKDSDGNFRFSHFSIQEFLALSYILRTRKEDLNPRTRITDFMRKLALSWANVASVEDRNQISFSFLRDWTINIDGKDFSGSNFSALDMSNSSFEASILRRAKFQRSNLKNSNFKSANLEMAQLEGADLTEANLGSSNLAGADFRNANLKGAKLEGATMDSADFLGAKFDNSTKLSRGINLEDLGATKYS